MKKWEVTLRHCVSGIRCVVLDIRSMSEGGAIQAAKEQMLRPSSWEFESITEVVSV